MDSTKFLLSHTHIPNNPRIIYCIIAFSCLKDAHPKGEIFLGHSSESFAVRTGVPPGARDQGFSFTLETPDRTYLLSAQSDDDRSQWINVIQKVIDKPLTPQDASGKRNLSTCIKRPARLHKNRRTHWFLFYSSGETCKKTHSQWLDEYIFVYKIGLDSS